MAFLSQQEHVSDGTLQSVSFSIAFLDKAHLHFYIGNDEVTSTVPVGGVLVQEVTSYAVTLTSPVPNGSVFSVRRVTPRTTVPHKFSNGAALFNAANTDENNTYALFIVQEVYEQSGNGPFPNTTTLDGTELLYVNVGGVRKQITVSNFLDQAPDVILEGFKQDLANDTDPAKGAGVVGYKGRTVFDRLSREVWVTDYPFNAKFDGVTDDAAAINAAMAYLNSIGGGVAIMPYGSTVVEDISIACIYSNVSLIGQGSGATRIINKGTIDAVVVGNGVTDVVSSRVGGFSVIGTLTSGFGVLGQQFTDQSELFDIYTYRGKGFDLTNCWSLAVNKCRQRESTGSGLTTNANCHNIVVQGFKSQLAAGHGYKTQGCYGQKFIGCNAEFNYMDQVHIASGRGISFDGTYIESIMPRSSGYAAFNVVAADTVTVTGGIIDGTQVAHGADGTATYLKVSGASTRVKMRDYGFATPDSTQTHVDFAAAENCEAIVPYGAVYNNSSDKCRIYNGPAEEVGVCAWRDTAQSFANGAWTYITTNQESWDGKAEFNAGAFTPKDYGLYSWIAFVGLNGLGGGGEFYVSLYNKTDAYEVAQCRINGSNITTYPVQNVAFTEKLIKGKEYQLRAYLVGGAPVNSIPGEALSRQVIKRIG